MPFRIWPRSWEKSMGIALQPRDVDPQLQCPLYNGTIPPDIREKIFEYATAEYVDPDSHYPTNTYYTRPNFSGRKIVSINLLLLCKRSYLEARHLPLTNKTHVFWYFAGPKGRFSSDIEGYFKLFQGAEQVAFVKRVHFFTQQFWLERAFPDVCRMGFLHGVEKVKITVRRGDWWSNERNAPLAITPGRPGAKVQQMKADWRREEEGVFEEWDPNSWGSAFRFWKGLRELEMELETYFYKQEELEEIVRHAARWEFPMGDGKALCSDGVVEASSWRGPAFCWTECPKCAGRDAESCKFCEEMMGLKDDGKGPMLIVRSMVWKLGDAKYKTVPRPLPVQRRPRIPRVVNMYHS